MEALTSDQGTFLALAAIAAVAAIGVVAFESPVRSALALVVNFFMLAFVYFTMRAQMLGISQILVYTGAIMVLFLFVIMLLNLAGGQTRRARWDLKPLAALVCGAALFGFVLTQVILPLQALKSPTAPPDYGSPQAIGKTLFTAYVWPFEVTSVLLLVGIVGSILLAKRRI